MVWCAIIGLIGPIRLIGQPLRYALPVRGRDNQLIITTSRLSGIRRTTGATPTADRRNTLNDTYLRLAAEYDNFRRRTAKEREGIYTDAFGEALSVLFPVVDNLERAAQYSDGENVAKGVELTLKSVRDTFTKLGVTEIDPVGEAFDPNFHNAVMHTEDDSVAENTITQVFQKGIKLGEKIVRFAMVQVAN